MKLNMSTTLLFIVCNAAFNMLTQSKSSLLGYEICVEVIK